MDVHVDLPDKSPFHCHMITMHIQFDRNRICAQCTLQTFAVRATTLSQAHTIVFCYYTFCCYILKNPANSCRRIAVCVWLENRAVLTFIQI